MVSFVHVRFFFHSADKIFEKKNILFGFMNTWDSMSSHIKWNVFNFEKVEYFRICAYAKESSLIKINDSDWVKNWPKQEKHWEEFNLFISIF